MIRVKIADIINGTEVLRKLAQADFKAKTAWQIARLLKAAEAEVQGFQETRNSLVNKYGEKNENGELVVDEKNNYKFEPENLEAFVNEFNDLVESEVEINANKLKIEQVEEADFTPSDMVALEPFIEMDEE